MNTEHNERPPQFTAIKQWTKDNSTSQCERKNLHHDIRMDLPKKKTGHSMLFLEHYDINQIECLHHHIQRCSHAQINHELVSATKPQPHK